MHRRPSSLVNGFADESDGFACEESEGVLGFGSSGGRECDVEWVRRLLDRSGRVAGETSSSSFLSLSFSTSTLFQILNFF